MKKLIVSMFLVFALVAVNVGVVSAVEAKKTFSPAQLANQERMKSCNKEATAKALKGDERKAFMKSCMSGKAVSATVPAPVTTRKVARQDKMKACNKDASAKALKGNERLKFMTKCLKK